MTAKVIQEVDDILVTEGPWSTKWLQKFSVKQQLNGKLEVLSDIDK